MDQRECVTPRRAESDIGSRQVSTGEAQISLYLRRWTRGTATDMLSLLSWGGFEAEGSVLYPIPLQNLAHHHAVGCGHDHLPYRPNNIRHVLLAL